MDAVKYIKARQRMCNSYTVTCYNCPLNAENNPHKISCRTFREDYPEEAVAIVEKWATEHPVMTRQDVFLKMFPHADCCTKMGIALHICPKRVDTRFEKDCDHTSCSDCGKQYWLAEAE